MLHQAYRYYRKYHNDGIGLKSLILMMVGMETFHTVLWIMVCYEYLVISYFNPLGLVTIHWYIRLTVPATAFTGILSGIFYAGRLYYLGPQYRPMVAIAVFVLLLSLGWDLAATVYIFRSKTLLDFEHFSWIVSVAYGLAVLCGIITVSALIFALRRSRTGTKRTNSVVDIIVLYLINTGLLTTVVGLFVFIFALIRPGNLIYAALSIPGVKLYSNSVLAMLNSRHSLSARLHHTFGTNSDDDGASRPTPPRPPAILETSNPRQVPILLPVTIDVTTSKEWDVEVMTGYSQDFGSRDEESVKVVGDQ
ncbi:hypothetical protein GY45DRAFT_487176 [Cubamyces sp. BRFM 1775]|nr:hypothetical protein GY45DRAFT_487176 [Cubamyces sp. BRFM 1775]